MQRTTDPEFLNSVLNHPEVRPHVVVPGQDVLDVTGLLADSRNIALVNAGGGFLCLFQETGIYEVHTQFLPEFRGKAALESAREALVWMFTRTDCMSLLTKVPYPNVAADQFARFVGFQQLFERDAVWVTDDGLAPIKYYTLDFNRWFARATSLESRGQWFHEQLVAKGHPADHLPDPAHDRAVGCCVEMMMAGQVDKGSILYNRWARFAGYDPVVVLQRSPLVVSIGKALVGLTPRGFDLIEV